MMKNAFNFILKALSILNIFKFLSQLFGHKGKRLNKKANFNFKIYDVDWITDNCNTRSKDNHSMKFGQLGIKKYFQKLWRK